jgi:hypothetical protein
MQNSMLATNAVRMCKALAQACIESTQCTVHPSSQTLAVATFVCCAAKRAGRSCRSPGKPRTCLMTPLRLPVTTQAKPLTCACVSAVAQATLLTSALRRKYPAPSLLLVPIVLITHLSTNSIARCAALLTQQFSKRR